MKRILIFLIVFSLFEQLFAQVSSIAIFNEHSDGFFLVVDRFKINREAQTIVLASGLKEGRHFIKIVFENKALGSIREKIFLPLQSGQVYCLVKNEQLNIGKGSSLAFKCNFPEDGKLSYKLEYYAASDSVNIQERAITELVVQVQSLPSQVSVPNNISVTSVKPAQEFGLPLSSANLLQTNETNIAHSSISIDYNKQPRVLNLPLNTQSQVVSEESSTTIAQTTANSSNLHGPTIYKALDVYTPPALISNGACSFPLTEIGFKNAMNSIIARTLDEAKLSIAKQIVQNNCLTSNQIKRIAMVFTFEESKLDFAKLAYFYCYDPQNFFIVNNVFTFESSLTELQKHIEP